jgi:DNA-binding transcriptional MerR regulator
LDDALISRLRELSKKEEIEKAELEEVKRIMKSLRDSGMSYKEIAEICNGRWSEATVRKYVRDVQPELEIVREIKEILGEDLTKAIEPLKSLISLGYSIDDIKAIVLAHSSYEELKKKVESLKGKEREAVDVINKFEELRKYLGEEKLKIIVEGELEKIREAIEIYEIGLPKYSFILVGGKKQIEESLSKIERFRGEAIAVYTGSENFSLPEWVKLYKRKVSKAEALEYGISKSSGALLVINPDENVERAISQYRESGRGVIAGNTVLISRRHVGFTLEKLNYFTFLDLWHKVFNEVKVLEGNYSIVIPKGFFPFLESVKLNLKLDFGAYRFTSPIVKPFLKKRDLSSFLEEIGKLGYRIKVE